MIYGIDIGATFIKIGLFDDDIKLINQWQIKTNLNQKGKFILSEIADFINQKNFDVKGYGFGIPGDVINNHISLCPNIKWKNINLVEAFSPLIKNKAKIVSGNDANVALLAEKYMGSGIGYENILMLTIGSGIGGGIMLNNKLIIGKDGFAGELGHIKVEFSKPRKCGCGKLGCLEAMASAKNLLDITLNDMPDDHFLKKTKITTKDIFNNKDDGYLNQKILDFANYLGLGIANMTCLLNPDLVIIGGGLSNVGLYLLSLIKKYHRMYCYPGLEKQKFVIAKHKNNAGILGAALLLKKEEF